MKNLLDKAQLLAKKCFLPVPRTTEEITVSFISTLYEKICQSKLEDPPLLPDLTNQPIQHLNAILDSLSCNFLNLDLDTILRAEDIIAGNEEALSKLFHIFDNLYNCFGDSQQTPNVTDGPSILLVGPPKKTDSRLFLGPTYKGKRISNIRSASVIYSPRTAAFRKLKRKAPARTNVSTKEESSKQEMLKQLEIRNSKPDRDEDILGQSTAQRRQYEAGERRKTQFDVKKVKACIRNRSVNLRHNMIMMKKATATLRLVKESNQMELTRVTKEAAIEMEALSSKDNFTMTFAPERKENRTYNAEIRTLLSNLSCDLLG